MRAVAAVSSSRVASSAARSGGGRALLARSFDGPPYFRAVLVTGEVATVETSAAGASGEDDSSLIVSDELLSRLGISDRGSAFWMPLPER
jgi:hypothetical protein